MVARQITPKSIVYDTEARRSVLYATVDTLTVIGPASMEFVMMLKFDETGNKVTRIDEFFDSAVYSSFFGRLQEYLSAR